MAHQLCLTERQIKIWFQNRSVFMFNLGSWQLVQGVLFDSDFWIGVKLIMLVSCAHNWSSSHSCGPIEVLLDSPNHSKHSLKYRTQTRGASVNCSCGEDMTCQIFRKKYVFFPGLWLALSPPVLPICSHWLHSLMVFVIIFSSPLNFPIVFKNQFF